MMGMSVETTEAAVPPPAPDSSRQGEKGGTTARIVYLVRREGLTSVFASQVARRMGAVADAGFEVDVGVFTPLGQWLRRDSRERWHKTLGELPPSLVGRVRRFPSLPSRFDLPMTEARLLRWWLKRNERQLSAGTRQIQGRSEFRQTVCIIQCRNATVTRMALWARRGLPDVKVIFDCRGLVDHEFLYERGQTFSTVPHALRRKAEQLGAEQREAALQSDAVFCVSQRMVDYLGREYGVPPEKCLVVPCCVDVALFAAASAQRQHMRAQLGFGDRFVVCYCGSLARYQLPNESLGLFRRIREIVPSAHFFAVTTAPDAMRSAARDAGVPADQMTIVSVGPAEVPQYLSAADIGLLLREQCAVNEVASPVKFGEYLASGTTVIMSDGIGDFSELARRERLGLVLDNRWSKQNSSQRVRGFLEEWMVGRQEYRRRCILNAHAHLDFDAYLPQISAAYCKMGIDRTCT